MSLTRELEALGAGIDEPLEKLNLAVALLDASGTIRWQNATSVARIGARRGVHYLGAIAPDYRRAAQTEVTRLMFSAQASTKLELVVVGPAGQRRRSLLDSVPVHSGARIVGVLFVAVPLT